MAKLYFYYSAMNAGKSALLIQSAHNYYERNLDTLILLPEVISKNSHNNDSNNSRTARIKSRIGIDVPALLISKNDNLFNLIKSEYAKNRKIACILIDEAQFLSKNQIHQLTFIVDQLNLPVLCYGIRSDFRAEPFEGSIYLLTLADHLIELKTICHCGSKATMNMRIDENNKPVKEGNQVLIGGNNKYIATCRKHFNEDNSGPKILKPLNNKTSHHLTLQQTLKE